ncbi:MAG TPA: discoidin domain-containing protein [Polyangiaceae bacterium]|nr:discoidin domain-containing protein [Polyangiaceae bacterium]
MFESLKKPPPPLVRLALWGLLVLLVACDRKGPVDAGRQGNLLANLKPLLATGVNAPDRLTDGVAAGNGEPYDSELAARLNDANATVVYDLGESRKIASVWLQGDNDDNYTVEISDDNKDYRRLWSAPSANEQGLQERFTSALNDTGRYLRVRARGGDGVYSLSEVQAFTDPPKDMPKVRRQRSKSATDVRTRALTFGLALLAFVFATTRRSPAWWLVVAAGLPLVAGALFFMNVAQGWPHVSQQDVSLVRGVIATVAALAVAREVFAPKGFEAHRGATLATLALTGALGVSAFYNLWQPQFFDATLNGRTFAHVLDMRQYWATAKYFPEIGYRGIYNADMAAYVEDTPGVTLESIANKPMRNLDDHHVSTVGAQRPKIEAVKQRFTPERWEAYKRDQRYLRAAMGIPAYFEFMFDFGGNATPVWITLAHYLFNATTASNQAFLAMGSLDLVLVLAALVAIGRTFGARTAFVCATIFGANDFIMYGTNWAGAPLRHDWMVYLAFGACALRTERWALGGFFLAMATLIRAFPALALIALGLPPVWYALERYAERREWPHPREIVERHKHLVRALAAAAVTIAVAVALTSALWGASSWGDWYKKVGQLQAEPHANHISLRSLVAGSEGNQAQLLRARMPVFASAAAFFVAMVSVGARKKRPEQIAMLGLILMPVFFYPANYYIHLVWLLPMLVIERRWATAGGPRAAAAGLRAAEGEGRVLEPREGWVWMTLLLMCAAQYFTTPIADKALHFYLAGVCLFSAFIVLLVAYVHGDAPELFGLVARLREPHAAGAAATAVASGADEHEDEDDDEEDDDDEDDDEATDSEPGEGGRRASSPGVDGKKPALS